MIIEDPEALKAWMAAVLPPYCDADPLALARYVCALVRKDKAEEDVVEYWSAQLEVFLQSRTSEFVQLLHAAIRDKSYLKKNEPTLPEIENVSNETPPSSVTDVTTIEPNATEKPVISSIETSDDSHNNVVEKAPTTLAVGTAENGNSKEELNGKSDTLSYALLHTSIKHEIEPSLFRLHLII